jgi:HPt (histidine-containing phosphotransfer) domain-containing protein
MSSAKDKCLAAGMNAFLTKPFTQNQLRAVMESSVSEGEPLVQQGSAQGRLKLLTVAASSDNIGERSVIDTDAFERFRALERRGAKGFLSRMINIYLEDSPQSLQDIKKAIEHGSADTVRRAAHKLKSSSADLGAVSLSALCAELEAATPVNCTRDATSLLGRIEELHASVCKELVSHCD